MRRLNARTRLVIGLSLLGIAWLFGNPPFAAPDERDHFVRVLGIANGQLVGAPAPKARIGWVPARDPL